MQHLIRLIEPSDNAEVEQMARIILKEVDCVGPGLSSEDAELKDMYTAFHKENSQYWVIVEPDTQRILGGGGLSRLNGTRLKAGICLLQRVYFYPEIRGQGLGKKFVLMLMQEALRQGFKEAYLETLPSMAQAVKLYQKLGFKTLSGPKGQTGHYGENIIYMNKPLFAINDMPYSVIQNGQVKPGVVSC